MLRIAGDQDAADRCDGGAGGEVHRFLHGCGDLHAIAGGVVTGCYPPRVSMGRFPAEPELGRKNTQGVLFPGSAYGLNPAEQTIGKVLKSVGYATACIGKWHLGDRPEFWPTKFGFDSYFGIPYSNDMKPAVLMDGEKIVEQPADQDTLVERYTDRAKSFIHDHKAGPFFLYLAYNCPHTPVHAAKRFQGTSERGLYGDAVVTIDWSVGEILDGAQGRGIGRAKRWWCSRATTVRGLCRARKAARRRRCGRGRIRRTMAGIACLALRWPGKIEAGRVCHEIAASMDFLPTVAKLSGADTVRPQDRWAGHRPAAVSGRRQEPARGVLLLHRQSR